MNLQSLTDQELIHSTDVAVKNERESTAVVIRHFEEVSRRRLFSALGYGSLFEWATKKLGYSADEAYNRISAAKLAREVPALEQKLENGSLNLTHVRIAQALFRHEAKNHDELSSEEKLDVIEKLENTSTREAQTLTHSFASSPMTSSFDQVRAVGESTVRISFDAPIELEEKLKNLKGLFAHSDPNMTMAELIDRLSDLGEKAWNPAKQKVRTQPLRQSKSEHTVAVTLS